MTGKVSNILERTPHNSGRARCLACRHEWDAVEAVGEVCLHCPECDTFRGVFKGHPAPEFYYQCNCGCSAFSVMTEARAMCLHCGLIHEMDDD